MQISMHQLSCKLLAFFAILVIHTAPICRAHQLRDLPFWRTFQQGSQGASGVDDDTSSAGPYYQQQDPLMAPEDKQIVLYSMDNIYDSDGQVPFIFGPAAAMHRGAITMNDGDMAMYDADSNNMPAKRTWRTVMKGERGGYYKRSSPKESLQLPKRTWRTIMRGEAGGYYKRSSFPDRFGEYFL